MSLEYTQRLEQEQYDRIVKFEAKLSDIAQALNFTAQPHHAEEYIRENTGALRDPAGRPIRVRWDQHKHRLTFDGDWPNSLKGEGGLTVFRPRQPISISVAFDRPAGLIAKDILRRFYSLFAKTFDETLQQKRWHEQYVSDKDATLSRAAELLGYHRTDRDRTSFSIYDSPGRIYVRVESYDDSGLKLDLHGSVARLGPALQELRKAIEEEQRTVAEHADSDRR